MSFQLNLFPTSEVPASPAPTMQLNLGTPGPTPVQTPVQSNSSSQYKRYDQRTHVYMKSDMYVGSDRREKRAEWIYNLTDKTIVLVEIDYVPAAEHLLKEIIGNASDAVTNARKAGVDPQYIDIQMDSHTVTVTNFGLPIPIEIHPTERIYNPQLIFGNMLTSQNYEVDRHGIGTNGIGAKATNIFSKRFMVIIHDAIRHVKYTQIWTNNMIDVSAPIIEQYVGTVSSVTVSYLMDFVRFGYDVSVGYPEEAFALYARHAADTSKTAKIPVRFTRIHPSGNISVEMNYSDIREYGRLYFGDAVDTSLVHYEWPPNTELVVKNKRQVAKNPLIVPLAELLVVDSPFDAKHISFVNCVMTKEGGVHVKSAFEAVGFPIVKELNEASFAAATKGSKNKELDASEKRTFSINIADVKQHMSILLDVRVVNPRFNSQTKVFLTDPTPKFTIQPEELKIINKWKAMEALKGVIKSKQMSILTKTDGKLTSHVKLSRGKDANMAGKADRRNCMLCMAEGDSGIKYIEAMIGLLPTRRDYLGTLPARGKGLNVRNAVIKQISENAEIKELKAMLGLREGVDYTIEENFNQLRYGSLMIMADADLDGKHIIGLILNFFQCLYPSLLARGFVRYWRSPIISVSLGKQPQIRFYTIREYEAWKHQTPNYEKYDHRYFKGMATSENSDVKEDLKVSRFVHCQYDENASATLEMAFSKDLANTRKKWMETTKIGSEAEMMTVQPISTFINQEFIVFCLANLKRAIPSLIDGFKHSQRQVIHGAHDEWNIGPSTNYKRAKVAQFAAGTAKITHYQHGEGGLEGTIINMAQEFVGGSNNVAWFEGHGQFGTRFNGGEAGAPRYIYVTPSKLMPYILRKEDRKLLTYVVEEGDKVEPEFYLPVVPMVLINGVAGIGSGWSTFIPNHHPLDCVEYLRALLTNSMTKPELLPYYRGYKGKIVLVDRRKKNNKNTETVQLTTINNTTQSDGSFVLNIQKSEGVDQPDSSDTVLNIPDEPETPSLEDSTISLMINNPDEGVPMLSMHTYGNFYINNNVVVINELPIGVYPNKYDKFLEKLVEEKIIKDKPRDNCSENDVYIELYGMKETPTIENLKLKKTFGISNMTLLDENGRPKIFRTSADVIEDFFRLRLPWYGKRKEMMLKDLIDDIQNMNYRVKFITAVLNGSLTIMRRKIADIQVDMEKLEIPIEIYKQSKTSNFSEDEIVHLNDQIVKKQNEYNILFNTSPQALWLKDLQEFEDVYCKMYNEKRRVETPITLNIVDTNTIQLKL